MTSTKSVTFAAGENFQLPPKGAARYLAIDDPESGRRHHVEIYSPRKLHPSKRNAYVWAADDLKKVRTQ
jgi:hypothetical protein